MAILGRGDDASAVKGLITKIIDDSQDDVQYFSPLEIPPAQMLQLGLEVRNSHKNNWCDRPRFSHAAGKYQGHVFHDYSNGDFNCVFDTKAFKDEFGNTTGFSPVIKFFKCARLDPDLSKKPKTMKFKHEGQISASKNYDFVDWDDFIFNLVVPILKKGKNP